MIEYHVEVQDKGGQWKSTVKAESLKSARKTRGELAELGHQKVRIVQVTTTHIREVVS